MTRVQQLVTLHVITWPIAMSCPMSLEVYKHLVRGIAQGIFRSFDSDIINLEEWSMRPHLAGSSEYECSKLRLVAFVSSHKGEDTEDEDKLLIYLRTSSVGATEIPEIQLLPISCSDRKYEEPWSDLLDFELTYQPYIPMRCEHH